MNTKTPRSSQRRSPRRTQLYVACGLLVIGAVSCLGYRASVERSVRELSYGHFKKMLARGEVRSVKVGQAELTGELTPPQAGAPTERFRTSRVGMERDEGLASMLDKHVPEGNYEA